MDTCTNGTHVWRWPLATGDVCECGKRCWDADHRSENLNGKSVEEQRAWLKAHLPQRVRA